MNTAASDSRFPWRQVAMAAFLPTILFSIGQGAVLPIIPVVAHQLGADLAGAGLISAMLVVGALIGDIPAGALIVRIGERTSMIGAAVLAVVAAGVSLSAPNPWVLGIGILLFGLASTVFAIARHAFMTTFVPLAYRARSLSTLGGTFRFGFLVGPFATAAVIQVTGEARDAFWIQLVTSIAALIVVVLLRDPSEALAERRQKAAPDSTRMSLLGTIAANRGVLLTVGSGSALVAALRSSRNVILPLWAVSIGLDGTTTAIIIGAAAAIDFVLFYTGGWITDRFGRLWTSVPAMIGLGASHLVLALSHDSPDAEGWFVAAAAMLALANGISSGILMTLGSDLADPAHPAPFLGAWRFTNDSGAAAAPLLIAGITAVASLPVAAGVMGVLGFLGALNLRVFLPRYLRE